MHRICRIYSVHFVHSVENGTQTTLERFYIGDIIGPVSGARAAKVNFRISNFECRSSPDSRFDVPSPPLTSDPPKDGFAVANFCPLIRQRTDSPWRTSEERRRFSAFTVPKLRERSRAFTLMELLTVISIISILLVLLAPAFTARKSADDMNNAVYTISGMLAQARTYAKANNTYAWIGFAGSIGSTVTGQVKVAIVASSDGTNLWTVYGSLRPASLVQVGKMMTLDNAHIGDTGTPTPNGTEFESRPAVDTNHRISSSPTTPYTFAVQGQTFNKWIQFSPRGEALVHGGGGYTIVNYVEVGVLPTHGTSLAATINLAAIEVSGYGGNVRVYRR